MRRHATRGRRDCTENLQIRRSCANRSLEKKLVLECFAPVWPLVWRVLQSEPIERLLFLFSEFSKRVRYGQTNWSWPLWLYLRWSAGHKHAQHRTRAKFGKFLPQG